MTWSAFLLAALKALPALAQLAASLKAEAEARANQGIGHDLAVSQTLRIAAARLAIAREVEAEADRDHAAKAGDAAFDPDFRRED